MKKPREHVIDIIFSLSLLCVFTVCGLMVVFMGISVYENTTTNMENAFSDRTAMAYVAKQVRQNDRTDGIYVDSVEGVTALVLAEEKDGEVFCTYIFYYDGYLQEIYAKESYEPVLSAGQALIQINGFDVIANEDGTLTLAICEADEDIAYLTLALQSEDS